MVIISIKSNMLRALRIMKKIKVRNISLKIHIDPSATIIFLIIATEYIVKH